MEAVYRLGSGWDVDEDRDPIGIVLEKDVVCGYCRVYMNNNGRETYRCPKCGFVA